MFTFIIAFLAGFSVGIYLFFFRKKKQSNKPTQNLSEKSRAYTNNAPSKSTGKPIKRSSNPRKAKGSSSGVNESDNLTNMALYIAATDSDSTTRSSLGSSRSSYYDTDSSSYGSSTSSYDSSSSSSYD